MTRGNPPAKPLRTAFCTRGGLFGALVLERLRACERIEICAIVRSTRVFAPGSGPLRGAAQLVRRCGLGYALYLLLATTIADLACSLAGRAGVLRAGRKAGIPVHATSDINGPDGLRFLEAHSPDLLVSAFFDQRLREPALRIPRASLNIHPSLLPSFKGVEPVLQAWLQRAPLGVSVHRMTPELDAGEILVQRPVAVPPETSIFATTAHLYRTGAQALVAVLELGRGTPSPNTAGSYQSWPSRSDVRALRARGGRLLRLGDWRCFLTRVPDRSGCASVDRASGRGVQCAASTSQVGHELSSGHRD
jgi:methionyl-tRNA formyltransferase